MGDIERRGRRVTGMFAFMIGAGVLLESSAVVAGTVLTVGGLALFAYGFVARRDRSVLAEEAGEKP
jgi:hypothetical protein